MKVKLIELSSDDMENIICASFEGGSTYWCSQADPQHEETDDYCPEGWAYQLINSEEEDNAPGILNAETLHKGVMICLEKFPLHVQLDGDFDASDADAIVQCAVFGDIIYG
jgi:hypothetical protein